MFDSFGQFIREDQRLTVLLLHAFHSLCNLVALTLRVFTRMVQPLNFLQIRGISRLQQVEFLLLLCALLNARLGLIHLALQVLLHLLNVVGLLFYCDLVPVDFHIDVAVLVATLLMQHCFSV